MIGADVSVAAELLQSGKLVAIPTETVYGLAANAFNSQAVLNIFKAKNRPSFDPLIVHIASFDWVKRLATVFPPKAQLLAETFWPGSLTIILPKTDLVPDVVTSGLPLVGLRMPNHSTTLELLSQLDFPLAAPSANPFGYVSPTTASHVADQLGDKMDYILDGGACKIGVESTIVSFEDPEKPVILRFGGISVEQIEAVVGTVSISISNNSNPAAPGQLDKHYATKKIIELVNSPELLWDVDQHQHYTIGYGEGHFSFNLSPTSNLDEIASNLFVALRLADQASQPKIVVSLVTESGIGRAINDRLRRAAAR
ncbi:MAG: threonylcarbamoyl-AMP synthase [Flavobacteriales bacterium]|nr:threonylcarbamoyl-AMP synthase [Flavobacteriales bacterium]